jgi:hypothetical protein
MRGIRTRILMGLVLLLGGIAALAAPGDPISKDRLVGTWRLQSAMYGPPGNQISYVPKEQVHLKHVTATHFTVITYEGESKKVTIAGGGPYSLQGSAYKETVDHAMGSLANLLGKEQSFTLKMDGDRWTHSGTLSNGQQIEEIWERVREPVRVQP